MADLAEKLLEKTAKEYAVLLGLDGSRKDAIANLRHQSASALLKGVKRFHDSIHSYDTEGRSPFITELATDNMDDEQVWQQQEVQMTAVKRFLHEQLTVTNLEQLSARLLPTSSKPTGKKLNGLSTETSDLEDDDDAAEDVSLKDDGDEDDDKDDDDGDEEDMEDLDSEDSDPELSQIKKRLKNDDDGFGDFGDADNDLFDGAQKEWDELEGDEDDEGDDENENDFDFDIPSENKVEKKQKEQKAQPSKKRKTEVDDKFFKLADMEEFLDQEDAKEERRNKRARQSDRADESEGDEDDDDEDDEGQKLDMFSAWSDDETEEDCMYADFFDPPEGEDGSQATAPESGSERGEFEEDDSEEDMDSDEDGPQSSRKKVRFSDNTKGAKEGGSDQQSLSNFEKRTQKLRRQIEGLEAQSVGEKPWQMMGEVGAGDRPENSMLEEHVEFRQAAPSAAEMTEERSKSIEDIILQRIKDKSFDDNVRQVRPVEEAFELKTQRTLSQEKSKLSLHEVYEQEFLKMQEPEEENKTNPVHDEIKKMMDNLFPCLDALASWHYTPLRAVPELKVKNNLPSIRMEEATPLTMSTSAVMAPEEIQAKKKGELKGKTERTKEDKNRERKKKKAAKREKEKEKEKRRKEVEKRNPGLGNKYSKQRALKELEKEAKGTIEVIKEKQKKKKGISSKAFFTQLQEEVTLQTAANKSKKKMKQKSSDKLLL